MLSPASTVHACPRPTTVGLVALLVALVTSLVVAPALGRAGVALADAAPKAVVIVGPASGATDRFLLRGEAIAQVAESYGMDVRRVFHPNATWDAVLANIQGAKLVVYLGHGNGWPSPYGPFQTLTKDGFGLNPYAGASAYTTKYYGEGPIAENVRLATNSIVLLNHLCYASGNGENGETPTESVAVERVDNFAAGFLKTNARAVFAYGHQYVSDVIRLLFTTQQTIDGVFMTPSGTKGFNGTQDRWYSSVRTPGKRLHLDPYPDLGWYRAVTGDLDMTTGEFLGAATTADATSPTLSSARAVAGWSTPRPSSSDPVALTPNGDFFSEKLALAYSGLSESGYLDISVADASGRTVREFSTPATAGSGRASWDGKDGAGATVPDGTYALSIRPRDKAGNQGRAIAVPARVLTALKSPGATRPVFFARDGDDLAPTSTLKVTLLKSAVVTWKLTDTAGTTVAVNRSGKSTSAGSLEWTWDGRDSSGDFVADGTYYSVVSATTGAGTVIHRTRVTSAAFRITPSVSSATAGQTVTFTLASAEPLSAKPTLTVTQPGLAAYTVGTTQVAPTRYRATVTLKSGGTTGSAAIRATGVDTNGSTQTTITSFRVR